MSKILFSLSMMVFVLCENVDSQQLLRQSYSCIGNSITSSKGYLSQTAGQPAGYTQYHTDGAILNAGFEQSRLILTKERGQQTPVLKVWPNPNNGVFSFQLIDGKAETTITNIFDSMGRVIYSSPQKNLSENIGIISTNLPAGLYFLQVALAGYETIVATVIIQ